MDRRRFLALAALTPAAALAATAGVDAARTPPARAAATPTGAAAHTFGFAADGSAFLLDGRPFQIRSGELHPCRIPAHYWRHRIRMARAMGLNTVSCYVMWNYVETAQGRFDFRSESRDIARFVRLAQDEGMWVLLRPGPYVCAEWDLGGLPSYLLADPDAALRVNSSTYPPYMQAVRRYLAALGNELAPLMIGNGGPILMVQVENEFGSYAADDQYVAEVRQALADNGLGGPFYTEDGLGQLENNHTNTPGGAIALSGGDSSTIDQARAEYPDVPAMSGELYAGWLTHWGDDSFATGDVTDALTDMMARGQSFNFYMLHGGTSFGFWAGANANDLSGDYQPDITSYDYSAPVTEQGRATDAYRRYRGIIADALGRSLPAIPSPVPTYRRAHGKDLLPRRHASVWDNLPAPTNTTRPQPMELHGQDFGLVLYRHRLSAYTGGTLDPRWIHDYATVFVDGTYQGGFSRPQIPDDLATRLGVTNDDAPLPLRDGAAVDSSPTLDILVEGMGRTNYGHALVDRKGILESVSLVDAGPNSGELIGWDTYSLPMDRAWLGTLSTSITDPKRPGQFFRAEVRIDEPADTYVDLSRWTKGVVWVNGHNLGRYWTIGPQHALYCPATLLRPGRNEVLIFDLHQLDAAPLAFSDSLR